MQDHPLGRLPEVDAPVELSPTGVTSGITSMLGMPACFQGRFCIFINKNEYGAFRIFAGPACFDKDRDGLSHSTSWPIRSTGLG